MIIMPVTFFYPDDSYDRNITLYADSISNGLTAYNKEIPIRDLKFNRENNPIYIELGYTGPTIKVGGTIDDYRTFIKYLELYPDTLLRTYILSDNYPEFNVDAYWEIKELKSKAVPGKSFLRTYELTVVMQHNKEVRG